MNLVDILVMTCNVKNQIKH